MKGKLIPLFFLLGLVTYGQTSGIKIINTSPTVTEKPEKPPKKTKKKSDEKPDNTYKTKESIEWKYTKGVIRRLEKESKDIKEDLNKNAELLDASMHYSESIKNPKYERLDKIEDSLSLMGTKRDNFYSIYVKDFIQFRRFNPPFFGVKRSEAFFDFIYADQGERFRLLTNTGFTLGEDTGTLYTELITGNLGFFRASLGVMVASSSTEDSEIAQQQEAYNRLASYGGNTVLTLEYPFFYLHSRNYQYNLISRVIGKGTADFPAFGTTTQDFAGSLWGGIDLYGDASLSNNAMRFFANLNIYRIFGSNSFAENLTIENSRFTFGQFTVGIVIQTNVKLSFILSSISSEDVLRNGHVIAGGQILPDFK